MLTPADWFIIAVVLISGVLSLFRGFLSEVISLVAWGAAFVVTSKFYERLAYKLDGWFDSEMTRKVVACIILFVMTLLVVGLCGKIIRSLVHTVGLSSTDRLLGMVFGVLRGVLILCVMLVILQMGFKARIFSVMEDQPFYRDSLLIPELERIVSWFFNYNDTHGTINVAIDSNQANYPNANYQQVQNSAYQLGEHIKQGVSNVVDQGLAKVQEYGQQYGQQGLADRAQQVLDQVNRNLPVQSSNNDYVVYEEELLNSTQGTIDLNSLQ